jgi:hypothetical protein
MQVVVQRISSRLLEAVDKDNHLLQYVKGVKEGSTDLYSAIEAVLASDALGEYLPKELTKENIRE